MAIYEYYCSRCGKHREVISRMGDFIAPKCGCGESMIKLISLPQPAIFALTNKNMFINSLNGDDKAYKFPGNGKHDKRYKAAVAKSLSREKPVIGKGF